MQFFDVHVARAALHGRPGGRGEEHENERREPGDAETAARGPDTGESRSGGNTGGGDESSDYRESGKGTKWPWDLQITYNREDPKIPTTAKMVFPLPR